MLVLTPAERRGGLVVVLLLGLGAGRDLWLASRPIPTDGRRAPVHSAVRAETSHVAPDPIARTGTGPSTGVAPVPVDLNRASVAELDALPGIGPVLARRIVEHRERHGPFRRSEELLGVRGIGPRLLEELRSRVVTGRTSGVAVEPGPGRATHEIDLRQPP